MVGTRGHRARKLDLRAGVSARRVPARAGAAGPNTGPGIAYFGPILREMLDDASVRAQVVEQILDSRCRAKEKEARGDEDYSWQEVAAECRRIARDLHDSVADALGAELS